MKTSIYNEYEAVLPEIQEKFDKILKDFRLIIDELCNEHPSFEIEQFLITSLATEFSTLRIRKAIEFRNKKKVLDRIFTYPLQSPKDELMRKTYFPIKIKIVQKEHVDFGKEFVVEHKDIPQGVTFKVLELCVKE